MADLEAQFQKAASDVKNIGTLPDSRELLTLYGLYKQATVGDCDQPKPAMFQLKDKAKHEAWVQRKGMSRDSAKQEYIDYCKKVIEKYGGAK